MSFNIHNGWDIANLHIHEAMALISQAYKLNAHITQKHENYIDLYHWTELLAISMEVGNHYSKERKIVLKAAILFQAGMEAWISWAYTHDELVLAMPKYFIDKWEHAFSHLSIEHNFSKYKVFYREIRNPVVHPTSAEDVEKVNNIWIKPVYEGIKNGWSAMECLSEALNNPFDQNSWDILCHVNQAPSSIGAEITDLRKLEKEILASHLIQARNEIDKE